MDAERTDRGRNSEGSDQYGILLLQFCDRVIVDLEAFLQLWKRAMSVSSVPCLFRMIPKED